jgi:hypothetical protein
MKIKNTYHLIYINQSHFLNKIEVKADLEISLMIAKYKVIFRYK